MELEKNDQLLGEKSENAKCAGILYRFSKTGNIYEVLVYLTAKNPQLFEKLQYELKKLASQKEAAKNSMTFSDYILEKTRTFAQEDYNKAGEKLIDAFRKFGAYTLDSNLEKGLEQ